MLIWELAVTVGVGFVTGMIARAIVPGAHHPSGFIFTVILGIVGAFSGTFLGQFFGYYRPGEQAGFGGTVVGAVFVLLVWGWFARRKPA